MIRRALISPCGNYRYWLQRKWGDNGRRVLWVMLNPSSADAEVDDPTVKRCIAFSQAWGFGELVIVNQYAYRSPDPSVLFGIAATEARGPDNDRWIRALANHEKTAAIVVAWGNGASARVPEVLLGRQLYCIGKTLTGAPKHPLARGKHRIPNGAPMLLY